MTRKYNVKLQLNAFESRINPSGDLVGAGELSVGHVDFFEIEFEAAKGPDEPAKLEIVVHDEDRDEEFSVDGTIFVVVPDAQMMRPVGEQFNFIGAEEGKTVWVISQIQNPRTLFGGISAEEIKPGTLGRYFEDDPRINTTNEFIRLELLDFNGPGHLSIWTNDPFGQPVVFWQTVDGIQAPGTPSDTLFAIPGSHVDMNFAFTEPGEYTFTVQATAFLEDNRVNQIESETETYTFIVQEGVAALAPKIRKGVIAVAPDAGANPIVRIVNPITGAEEFQVQAYEPEFRGGVNIALGDVNGDGIPDLITGAGAGGGPRIEVFDGATGLSLGSFFAFEPEFTGGVTVALGDINGDGVQDIIVGAGAGGGPRVSVFSGVDRSVLANFFAYEPTFTGGVNVSAGDFNGDGNDDIAVGSGVGGGPRVVVFSGADQSVLRNFFAYEDSFRGGVNVALADLTENGRADLIVGSGVGGGPRVRVIANDADDNESLLDFFAFPAEERGGVRVAAVDSNGDEELELILASGTTGQIARFDLDGDQLNEFFSLTERLGVRVAGTR